MPEYPSCAGEEDGPVIALEYLGNGAQVRSEGTNRVVFDSEEGEITGFHKDRIGKRDRNQFVALLLPQPADRGNRAAVTDVRLARLHEIDVIGHGGVEL